MNTDTIRITPEMLALLSEIDEFKGAWRALGTLAPERLRALRRIATIESIGSSTPIGEQVCTTRNTGTPEEFETPVPSRSLTAGIPSGPRACASRAERDRFRSL